MANRIVFQFAISLKGIKPAIWRRIQVPKAYSFWDLHVAVQDSMGWLDCHLHAFRFGKGRSYANRDIGIPYDEGFSEIDTLPGWEVSIVDHFQEPGDSCIYEYDFGDSWTHEVTLEGILLAKKGRRYPICIDGARACPPEDCGGPPGYYHLIEVLSDEHDAEYEYMTAWLGKKFDPENFVPDKVKFDNPKKRWDIAFTS